MRFILALMVFFVLSHAWSAGTEEPQTAVKLYRGTSIIAASDPNHATYRANFTLDSCMALKAERWQAEAETKTSGPKVTYRCQLEERSIITFHSDPTCPPLPPPEGRVVDCPAGFTGAYTQTRSYTVAPYPTCAVLGEWTEPPAGACTPIPTEQWTFCANEWETCRFTGTRRVRYGSGTVWVERDVTDGVECRNSVFGDPVPGVTKRCELLNSGGTDPEPPPTGSVSLSWTPPTTNTDGSALTNLAGYRIAYGLSAMALTQSIQLPNPGLVSYTLNNLAPGTYYFAVRAYTNSGTESSNSNVVDKVIP